MADQIDIKCPYCKGEITIDREWIGQKGECPYCNRKFMLSEPTSDQDDVSYEESVQSATDESAHAAPRERNKFAGKSSFRGNSKIRKLLVLGITGALLLVSLIVLGIVFLWIKGSGHKGIQLWKDGPYWAETNIGAENPWDYGYYFWWGDTIGYKRVNDAWVASDGSSSNFEFDTKNVFTYDKDLKDLHRKGWTREDGMLTPEHDAAHVHWGGKWRMPTQLELEVLCDSCDWTWTKRNGIWGYVIRGRGDYSTASIFLPCAGYGGGTSLRNAGSHSYYWSSVPGSDYGYDDYAWYLHFDSGDHDTSDYSRYLGHSVRPVQGFTK